MIKTTLKQNELLEEASKDLVRKYVSFIENGARRETGIFIDTINFAYNFGSDEVSFEIEAIKDITRSFKEDLVQFLDLYRSSSFDNLGDFSFEVFGSFLEALSKIEGAYRVEAMRRLKYHFQGYSAEDYIDEVSSIAPLDLARRYYEDMSNDILVKCEESILSLTKEAIDTTFILRYLAAAEDDETQYEKFDPTYNEILSLASKLLHLKHKNVDYDDLDSYNIAELKEEARAKLKEDFEANKYANKSQRAQRAQRIRRF